MSTHTCQEFAKSILYCYLVKNKQNGPIKSSEYAILKKFLFGYPILFSLPIGYSLT